MKKIIGSMLVVVALASCSKSHICECTESYEGTGNSWEITLEHQINDMKKKDAKVACDAGDGSQTLFETETYTKECELR